MHFGVIGSGVVGLCTALELQSEYRNASVTIVADKFGADTTSAVAAGIFRPGTSFSGPTEEITRKWIRDAYDHWDGIRKSEESAIAGVTQLSGYIFSNTSPEIVRNEYLEEILPIYRQTTPREQIDFGNWQHGSYFQTLLTEFNVFHPWATAKFLQNGGKIVQEKVEKFSNLIGRFDVVLNCTGLASKWLCADKKVVPIRGQVIKVHAPWLKMAFYGDFDTYIIPGFEGVTLGGCRQYESFNLELSKHDSAAIRERCNELVPSLKTAPVIREAVGLRPHRDPVRVEIEFLDTDQGRLKLVHNYGHGGYGVTTAPGTAKHAVQLVRDVVTGHSRL